MKETKTKENVSEHEERNGKKMSITKEQAKYWYAVAKKDLLDGNKEGAWNVYRWLKENNAWFHAKQLRKALGSAAQ